MYLTYANYQNMGGTLDEATFSNFEFVAESYVNWYTFSRLKTEDPTKYPTELGKCMFNIIAYIKHKYDASLGINIATGETVSDIAVASQSNDGVSISYNILKAGQIVEATDTEVKNLINLMLDGVKDSLGRKLLYRGLYPGE